MRDPVSPEEERLGAIANSLERVLRKIRDYQTRVRLDHHQDVEGTDQVSPPGELGDTLAGSEQEVGGASGRVKGWCCGEMESYRSVFPSPTRLTVYKDSDIAGKLGVEFPAELYCRWCGTPISSTEEGE